MTVREQCAMPPLSKVDARVALGGARLQRRERSSILCATAAHNKQRWEEAVMFVGQSFRVQLGAHA
jgi:hypothetical protein